MNKKIKPLLILIFLLFNLFLFSQETSDKLLFNSVIKKKATEYKSFPFFYKAASYFIEEAWDSTLVYTAKQLNSHQKKKDLKDFTNYLRGHSFKQKLLFKEAQKEFKLISLEFEFYNLVKFRLGQLSLELNHFKEAIVYYQELAQLPEDHFKYFNKSLVYHHLGLCYLHLKEFDKAEPFLIENVRLIEQKKDTLELIAGYGNLANLYYEQYKDDLAIPYFEKAYALSKSTKSFKKRSNTSLNMSVVEENRKDFSKALTYRKEYEQWQDSINNQNRIYEVAKIEKEFAVKQKQQEVNLLAAENKAKVKERNGLLYSALTLLILLGVTFYFYKEKTKTNKIVLEQKERLNELNATKDKLFSIVSHDLRSSVNALKTSNNKLLENLESKSLDTLKETLKNNSNIVGSAYSLLDNLLHWALLQTKQSYFQIEQTRLFFIVEQVAENYKSLMEDKGIAFKNSVQKTDKVFTDQESLKIILRNLIDNAIKFSKAKDHIHVYTQNKDSEYCNLIIEDSGLGISKTKLAELLMDETPLSKKEHENTIGTGLGLQLCKTYIEKNKGIFSIESTLKKGTKMIVSLPKATSNG